MATRSISGSSSKSSLHDSSTNLPSIDNPTSLNHRSITPTLVIDSSKIRPLSRGNRTSSDEIIAQNGESAKPTPHLPQTALGSISTVSLPNPNKTTIRPSSAKTRTYDLKSTPNLTEHGSASEGLVRLLKDEKLKVEKRDLMVIQLKQQLNENIKEKHKLKSILNTVEEYKQGFMSIEEILCTKSSMESIISTSEMNGNSINTVSNRTTELISRALDVIREISELREKLTITLNLKNDLAELMQLVEEFKSEIAQKDDEISQLEDAQYQLQQILNVAKFDSFVQTENTDINISTEDFNELCQCVREFLEVSSSESEVNSTGFHGILTDLQNALIETKTKLTHFEPMETKLNRILVENRANRETIARLAAEIPKFDEERTQHQIEINNWREETNKISILSKCYEAEIISLKHQLEETFTQRNMLEERVLYTENKCEISSNELLPLQSRVEELELTVEFYQAATEPLFTSSTRNDNDIKAGILSLQNELFKAQSELLELSVGLGQKNTLIDELTPEINVLKAAKQHLEIKNESFTREIYVLDTEKNRLLAHQAQISEFYKQLGRAMQLDPDLNFVLEGDIAKDTLISRAEQLSQNEGDKLTEKLHVITSLRSKLKLSQQQLSNKQLQYEILTKRYATLENKFSDLQLKDEENKKLNENNQKVSLICIY